MRTFERARSECLLRSKRPGVRVPELPSGSALVQDGVERKESKKGKVVWEELDLEKGGEAKDEEAEN